MLWIKLIAIPSKLALKYTIIHQLGQNNNSSAKLAFRLLESALSNIKEVKVAFSMVGHSYLLLDKLFGR